LNILVTGVAGFIGSNLADRLLAEGHQVSGLDNLAYGVKEQVPEGVRFQKGDVRSKDIYPHFKGMDAVFHLAAKNCIADCQEDPVETADINVTGTVNVLEACKQAGVRKVVYAESSAVYEGSKTYPTPEEDEHAESFYAASKLAEKHFAGAFARFHKMDLTALRYFCVYGPRQDYKGAYVAVIMKMLDAIDAGEPLTVFGDGSQAYDFVHVADCARANVLAMRASTQDRFYNVGTGVRTSIKELAEMIVRLTGANRPMRHEPGGLTFVRNRIGCPRRAAAEIGFTAATGLEEGLRDLIRWRARHKAARAAGGAGARS